ncbi:tetratricopeptide repeat protein [Candidatus Babeliales bacterium]|nr:tetratricopeptide repeat protein [Candidatus Babeliales bacterium]
MENGVGQDVIGEKLCNKGKLGWFYWLVPSSVLSILTLVFYYPSLKYPFQFDDLANITKNFNIRSFNFWAELGTTQRWLGMALNKLNFQWGRFDPWCYRSVNLTIHIMAGVLVFALVSVVCMRQKGNEFLRKYALWIASLSSALFLLHPIQTQAVSYVIQARLEGLAAVFILSTLLLMVLSLQARLTVTRLGLFGLGVLTGVASCGTKEIVIVTPFLLMLIDWFFISEWQWSAFKKNLAYHAIFTGAIVFTLLRFLGVSFMGNVAKLNAQTHNNKGNILTDAPLDMITPMHFLISEFKVILHHLRMAIFPVGMSVEYDWKLSESFLAPDSFLSFLALAGIYGGALYAALVRGERVVTFGLFWFLIAVLPRCSIIASPELVCDYKAYLAYAGLFFTLAILFVRLVVFALKKYSQNFGWLSSVNANVINTSAIVLATFLLGSASLARNHVWSSTIVFWEDAVRKAPGKARAHNNLGVALSEANKYERAIPHYLQAVQLDKFYSDPWSNLAVAYSVSGRDDEAIDALRQAIRLSPSYPEAYNNLGTLLLKKKNYGEAEKILQTAIKLRPYYGKAFFNLGRMYLEKDEKDNAWEYFQKATQGDLDTKEGFFALGQVGIRLGHYKEAVDAFNKAILRGGLTPQLEFCLANAYYLDGQVDKAEQSYRILHERFPRDGRFTYNLAETLFVRKKFDEAESLFRVCWGAGEDFPSAYSRVASCIESSKGIREAMDTLLTASNSGKLGPRALETVGKELGRLRLQDKISNGDGVITGKDLREAFGQGVADEVTA